VERGEAIAKRTVERASEWSSERANGRGSSSECEWSSERASERYDECEWIDRYDECHQSIVRRGDVSPRLLPPAGPFRKRAERGAGRETRLARCIDEHMTCRWANAAGGRLGPARDPLLSRDSGKVYWACAARQ
jgi:hypothetical protein